MQLFFHYTIHPFMVRYILTPRRWNLNNNQLLQSQGWCASMPRREKSMKEQVIGMLKKLLIHTGRTQKWRHLLPYNIWLMCFYGIKKRTEKRKKSKNVENGVKPLIKIPLTIWLFHKNYMHYMESLF